MKRRDRLDVGPNRVGLPLRPGRRFGIGHDTSRAAVPKPSPAMPRETHAGPDAIAPLRHRDEHGSLNATGGSAIHVGRRGSAGDPRIARALRHMEENHDLPLTVAELSGVAGLPQREFRERFNVATGRTPQEHLTHLRVAEAQKALLETDLDLGSVALLCGFGSRDDLSACFEARVGQSPRDWRAARR